MSDDDALHAPGWAAIDRIVGACFPGQVPHQFTSTRPFDLEGTTPLPAITVWPGGAPDHWLFVTYGLSELFDKTSPDPDVSGFGYELTFRVPRAAGEDTPPTWPLALLHGIAHHIFAGEAALDSGHVIDLGTPLVPTKDGAASLSGLLCVPDPRLGKVATVHGSLLFVALFGLTSSERALVAPWDLPRKVGLVTEISPLVVTDPRRVPLADDPRTASVLRRYATGILV